jgi:hypothetical protein
MTPSEFELLRRALVVEPSNVAHFVSDVGALLVGDPVAANEVLSALDPNFGSRSGKDVMVMDALFDGGSVVGVSVILRGPLTPDPALLAEKFKSAYFAPGVMRFFWALEVQSLTKAFKELSADAQRALLEYSLYMDWYEQQLVSMKALSEAEASPAQTLVPTSTERLAGTDNSRVGKFVVPSYISLLPPKRRQVVLKMAIAELKALVAIEHSYMLRRDVLLQALGDVEDVQLGTADNFSAFIKTAQTRHSWAAEALEPLHLSMKSFRGKLAQAIGFHTSVTFTAVGSRLTRICLMALGLGIIIGAAIVFGMEYARELHGRRQFGGQPG